MPKPTDESQRFVLSAEDIVEVIPRDAPTPKRSEMSLRLKEQIKQRIRDKAGKLGS